MNCHCKNVQIRRLSYKLLNEICTNFGYGGRYAGRAAASRHMYPLCIVESIWLPARFASTLHLQRRRRAFMCNSSHFPFCLRVRANSFIMTLYAARVFIQKCPPLQRISVGSIWTTVTRHCMQASFASIHVQDGAIAMYSHEQHSHASISMAHLSDSRKKLFFSTSFLHRKWNWVTKIKVCTKMLNVIW